MRGLLVDSNIILDIFLDDPKWADWAVSSLDSYSEHTTLYINSIIYSEVSVGFQKIEELESTILKSGFKMLEVPREALFLAGKAYLQYKREKGIKRSPLPDFFIGAQAAVLDLHLITRDKNRYITYFPTVKTIFPE